jgi:23S rRNA pseudouridine955/2504/2580 synthase/23S rRNA pseudouridine1911/1915/1917 synthase
VVFEDENFVAVNKPSGLLSIPDREQSSKSLKEMLLEKYGAIYTVHRLDKDTSGLIIFAKNEQTHKYFSRLFEERKIEKFYLGIVLGNPAEPKGEITLPMNEHPLQKGLMQVHRNGKPAHTGYEVIEASRLYTLVSFQLHTGRTHQIRLHTKSIGHPLACDPLYGDGKPVYLSGIKKGYKAGKHDDEERPMIGSLALHSYRLNFIDEKNVEHQLVAEMPKTYRALMQQLKKNN